MVRVLSKCKERSLVKVAIQQVSYSRYSKLEGSPLERFKQLEEIGLNSNELELLICYLGSNKIVTLNELVELSKYFHNKYKSEDLDISEEEWIADIKSVFDYE